MFGLFVIVGAFLNKYLTPVFILSVVFPSPYLAFYLVYVILSGEKKVSLNDFSNVTEA